MRLCIEQHGRQAVYKTATFFRLRDGLLDANPTTPVDARSWNFVSVGRGRPVRAWSALLAALREVGYDGVINIENEDHELEPEEALRVSVATLRAALAGEAGTGNGTGGAADGKG